MIPSHYCQLSTIIMSCAPLTMQPVPVPKAKPLYLHQPIVLKASVEATYLFERLINEGSTACVYEARSRHTDQVVAVKEIRRTPATSGVVQNERDMLRGLDHPNIARLLDFDETPTSYFIVQVRLTLACRMAALRHGRQSCSLFYPRRNLRAFKPFSNQSVRLSLHLLMLIF